MKKNTTEITVFKDVKVRVIQQEDQDYFCITDLAKYKNPDRPDLPVGSWINAKPNLDAVHEWELLHNPDFKPSSEGGFKGYEKYLAEAFMKDASSLFGRTAKDWRQQNADKPADRNQRDYASILDLMVLHNLEFLDSMLLQWDCDKTERRKILQEAYDFQYPLLKRSKTVKDMEALAKGKQG